MSIIFFFFIEISLTNKTSKSMWEKRLLIIFYFLYLKCYFYNLSYLSYFYIIM